jgi:hypothetical protein
MYTNKKFNNQVKQFLMMKTKTKVIFLLFRAKRLSIDLGKKVGE